MMNAPPMPTVHLSFPDENITPQVNPPYSHSRSLRSGRPYRPSAPLQSVPTPLEFRKRTLRPRYRLLLPGHARARPPRLRRLPRLTGFRLHRRLCPMAWISSETAERTWRIRHVVRYGRFARRAVEDAGERSDRVGRRRPEVWGMVAQVEAGRVSEWRIRRDGA